MPKRHPLGKRTIYMWYIYIYICDHYGSQVIPGDADRWVTKKIKRKELTRCWSAYICVCCIEIANVPRNARHQLSKQKCLKPIPSLQNNCWTQCMKASTSKAYLFGMAGMVCNVFFCTWGSRKPRRSSTWSAWDIWPLEPLQGSWQCWGFRRPDRSLGGVTSDGAGCGCVSWGREYVWLDIYGYIPTPNRTHFTFLCFVVFPPLFLCMQRYLVRSRSMRELFHFVQDLFDFEQIQMMLFFTNQKCFPPRSDSCAEIRVLST